MGDVKVVVRFRPQQNRELREGGEVICSFDGSGRNVSMNGQRRAAFTFDKVFPLSAQQEDIYAYAARPIVEDVLKGYNGTIFAYGQTSSGKTHTMQGPDIDTEQRGVIPRIVQDIFGFIEIAPESFEFTVRISYFEIYMEKIRDLLADGGENLQIHEDRERGVYVKNATELYMQSPEEVLDVIRSGADRRSSAQTNMNDSSSRSHAVVLLEITQKDTEKGGSKTGKLYLVDLAGSEKVSKTGADGSVLDEAKNINKSLSALGLVIMSLTEGSSRSHIPYRDSKLTRILQESLGGNARTTIICCCSPSSHNEMETLSTLQFGKRAKKVKNNAKVNVQFSAAELQKQVDQLKAEMKKLVKKLVSYEKELEIWRSGGTVSEADRAQLAGLSEQEQVKVQQAAAEAVQQKDTGLADEERESFMQRESELLDLLDDKDEEIRDLNREIDQLGEDKVTITKLAGEVHGKKQAIEKLDAQIAMLQEDHALFESNIEELVMLNDKVTTERDELTLEKENLLKSIEVTRAEAALQLQQTGEQISAMLASKTGGRQLPQVPVTVPLDPTVEVPLNRAKQYITQLQSEAKNGSLSDEEALAMKQKLEQAALDFTELEAKYNSAAEAKTTMETQIAQTEGKLQERETEMTNLIEKLIEMEMLLSEKGESESKQAQETREIEASAIKKLQEEKADMTKELKDTRKELEEAKESMSVAESKLKQAELDMKNLQETQASGPTGPVLSDATNIKLEQYKALRNRLTAQLSQKTSNLNENGNKKKGSLDFKTFYENKLEQKNSDLNMIRHENRELRKEVTAKEARINEMRNRMKQKENKVVTLTQTAKGMEQSIKLLKDEKSRRSSTGRAVQGGRKVLGGGGGGSGSKPVARGVRGGGQARGDNSRKWPVEDSIKRKPAPAPVVQDPEQVEYV